MARGVVMTDDLDAIARGSAAVAMIELKSVRFPMRDHLKRDSDPAIVITRYENRLTLFPQSGHETRGGFGRGSIMHEIAQQNEPRRLILGQQFQQPCLDKIHPPERMQAACRALAQFEAEMQIRHSQPALTLVK